MHRLTDRLKRLEQARCVGIANRRCPECGRLPNGQCPEVGSVKFEVTFEEPERPDYCTRCGGQLIYRITFDDRG